MEKQEVQERKVQEERSGHVGFVMPIIVPVGQVGMDTWI